MNLPRLRSTRTTNLLRVLKSDFASWTFSDYTFSARAVAKKAFCRDVSNTFVAVQPAALLSTCQPLHYANMILKLLQSASVAVNSIPK